MTTNNTPSLLLALPEDVQRRLLAGCRYEDLFSLGAACRAVRDVVNSPRFTNARLAHGFAERTVVLVGTRRPYAVDIRSAQTRAVKVSITGELELTADSGGTTTDGRRLFVSCKNAQLPFSPTVVYALDVISRRWSLFARLSHNRSLHCMEWYAGRLYVAGGVQNNNSHDDVISSFCVYNEATRSWDALPDMPICCCYASSVVIGDLLLIAGGQRAARTLQIFNFTTGQWRLGPTLPQGRVCNPGVVSEGKLFIPSQRGMLIYDPLSNAWTREPPPFDDSWMCACAHNGRIIAFLEHGGAYERAPDGTWFPYRCTAHAKDALEAPMDAPDYEQNVPGNELTWHDDWGTTRAESILLG